MVKWTDHALAQLRHIHDYIAHDSPFYAKRVSEEIVRKTVGLDEHPYLGRKVPELNEEHIRELASYSYRIIYEIKNSYVEILAVVHKRRDFAPEDLS
ncbi:MAG: type II toxin-antitoxin system RelE/ParE family toxin [Methylobacter tundripaludum]|jgi:plasmid stabilization system protein ParE|uniref:Plasmid stabilization system protein ParE n=1 Tax=Methylobacter tundripaludum TaxID=173365 RepID=A0A2S6HCR8_9GAMM|nr:type II toxin-antitoxin system RelE/ParE family toxin [Methylobacter tundripaludum]MDD4905202.1 type II toxin-antitoxin system RelE/ParE family toxin [Methylobacter tundripaludum]PPK75226.1 plasmid stabilization system protein ParE [Methylobacter tundripaludum]